MNIWTILIIFLILGAFGGGKFGYFQPTYGYGGGTLLIVILAVLLLSGRL